MLMNLHSDVALLELKLLKSQKSLILKDLKRKSLFLFLISSGSYPQGTRAKFGTLQAHLY